MRRIFRHLALAAAVAVAVSVAWAAGPRPEAGDRISLLTSWLCVLFLAVALVIGPLHARRTGRPLLNHLPRRDFGIWGAITGLVHFGLAFEFSMNEAYMATFIDGALQAPGPLVRRELYKWSVIAGIAIAVLFALLLALSSNMVLRWLGPAWWKRLQRASYLAFLLTIAHGIVFQVIESRAVWLVVLLWLLTGGVVWAQASGFAQVRRAGGSCPAPTTVTRRNGPVSGGT